MHITLEFSIFLLWLLLDPKYCKGFIQWSIQPLEVYLL